MCAAQSLTTRLDSKFESRFAWNSQRAGRTPQTTNNNERTPSHAIECPEAEADTYRPTLPVRAMASYQSPSTSQKGTPSRYESSPAKQTMTGGSSSSTSRRHATSSTTNNTSKRKGTMAARPTEGRIQTYLSAINPVRGSECRPTEAQLRWAQFHSKSKARYTRSVVEALMQHPTEIYDVVGARDGDGDTTEESYSCSSSSDGEGGSGSGGGGGAPSSLPDNNSMPNPGNKSKNANGSGAAGAHLFRSSNNEHTNTGASPSSHSKRKRRKRRKKKRKKGQLAISRGRRATLRVSERATEERRRDIAKLGYRRRVVGGDDNAFDARHAFDAHANSGKQDDISTPVKAHPTPPMIPGSSGRSRTKLQAKLEADRAGGGNSGNVFAEAFGEDVASFATDDHGSGIGGASGAGSGSGVVSNSPFRTATPWNRRGTATEAASESRSAAKRGFRTNQGRSQTASTARFTQDLDECDEDRVRRFEQALSALKISTSVTTTTSNATGKEGGSATKRWTRPANVATASGVSPYFDIQRGGSYRYGAVHSPTNAAGGPGRGASASAPFDRGASWLVHMPKVVGSADRRAAVGTVELQDKGASWLTHVPRAMPHYSVEKGRLIVSPTNASGEQVESPELQDRAATWMEHMPNKEDRLAAERAAAAASRSLRVDVTAEASGSPEKVLSPGEAKFNEIISQFQSIEAMLAAQRARQQQAEGGEHTGGHIEPVISPTMSQMHVLQTTLAANKAAAGGAQKTPRGANGLSPMSQFKSIQDKLGAQKTPKSEDDPSAPSPLSQFNSIQDKLGNQKTPKSETVVSPMSQFTSIQDKLRSEGKAQEQGPEHEHLVKYFSSATSKGGDAIDPMATAVATSGAKAAGIKLTPGRESLSTEEANLLRHEGKFDVPDAPTPKHLEYASTKKNHDPKATFDKGGQMAIREDQGTDNDGKEMVVHEAGGSRRSSGSLHSSEQENQQQGNQKMAANVGQTPPVTKDTSDTTDSAPRKGGVSFIRKVFSPGEKKNNGAKVSDASESAKGYDHTNGKANDAATCGTSPTEAAMHYGFTASPGTSPRHAVDPPGDTFSPRAAGPLGDISSPQAASGPTSSAISDDGSHQQPSEISSEERMNEMKNVILTRCHEESGQVLIDTDGTTSDVSGTGDEYAKLRLGSLMLSPTILTKRYQQAVGAIEARNWEQITYLLSANPWLAEMSDVRNDQYLLHKLALYGSGEGIDDSDSVSMSARSATAAPEQLTLDLIEKCPAAVHKFDHEGNLPLHMSATSGNLDMIKQLGERFSSGASVQNHEGMLPLHLAVLSCAYPSGAGGSSSPSGIVRAVLDLFPGGIGVVDNEGNLPLHIAAANLSGDLGVDILFLLLDEAEKQAPNLRLRRDTRVKTMSKPGNDDDDGATDVTATTTDVDAADDETPFCNLVKNKDGNTPLREAIETHAGWQIIEMLIQGGGGQESALEADKYTGLNALHLLIRGEYADPASVLSLLKIMPRIATYPDGEGVLPIEAACMASMPRAVILALVLVDLPVDLDDKDAVKVREGHGASWSFLTCDCDDAHIDIVEEVLSICSYRQTRELCFLRSGDSTRNGGTVISRATPKSKAALRKALRFVGRYEFLGSSPVHSDASEGLKVFEALDFGTEDEPIQDGRAVLLKCFSKEEPYLNEISRLKEIEFDSACVERVDYFCVHDFEAYSSANAPQQFCVAVEKPSLALARVVAGSGDYRQEPQRFHKYLSRVSMVLRLICKAVHHLHGHGLVHSNISLLNCGKFGDKWKLMGITGAKLLNEDIPTWSMGESVPPEATTLTPDKNGGLEEASVKLHETLKASPSVDAWAFGKLMYEVLVGEPLIPFDYNMEAFYNDRNALVALAAWDESTLRDVVNEVVESGAGTLAADLISHCLCPSPKDRPKSFDEILSHPFWKDQRQIRKGNAHGKKKDGNQKRRMLV